MNIIRLGLIVSILLCAACAQPLKDSYLLEGRTVAVEDFPLWASGKCESSGLPAPSRPFETDLCSGWPETYEEDGSDWTACCIVHDAEYWCGGSEEQRLQSDRKLRECVERESTGVHSQVMYMGIRMLAHPVWPFPWRWGFGRKYPMFYGDYDELKQASKDISGSGNTDTGGEQ